MTANQTPCVQEGFLSNTGTNLCCPRMRWRDGADVVPQDVPSVQCLLHTGSTSAAAPPELARQHPARIPSGIPLELGPPLSCGLCAGCRHQCANPSYAVVLLFNILCEKSFSVGTVYIVNKVDEDKHWIGVLFVHFREDWQ